MPTLQTEETMTIPTAEELDEAERLSREATPGPWRADSRCGMDAVYTGEQRNCLHGDTDMLEAPMPEGE